VAEQPCGWWVDWWVEQRIERKKGDSDEVWTGRKKEGEKLATLFCRGGWGGSPLSSPRLGEHGPSSSSSSSSSSTSSSSRCSPI
jgi:hypothetical protein